MKITTTTGLSVFMGLVLMACGATSLRRSNNEPPPVRIGPEVLNAAESGVGRLAPIFSLSDVNGKHYRLTDLRGTRGTVVCIISTSCPISKKYTSTYARLQRDLQPLGFSVIFVNPMEAESFGDKKSQAKALGAKYLLDPKGEVASSFGATTTTEVFLLDSARTVRYRGALDDQYGFSYTLAAPKQQFLLDAARSVGEGRDPAIRATTAPGCALENPGTPAKMVAETYHNRISRIIDNHCVSCHRPGGVGPFRLDNYADLKVRANMVKFVVDSKRMPPWFAAPQEGEKSTKWANDPTLSEADKKALLNWVAAGTPEGDRADAPLAKTWPQEWTIGTPSQVVQLPRTIAVQAEGFMDYVNVVVDPQLKQDQWVQAIQIMPTAKQVVHHVLVFVVPPGGRPTEGSEGLSGFFAGYVPGNDNQVFPDGFAKRLESGSKLRFQIHYTPNGTATTDQMRMAMVYAKSAPKREIHTGSVASLLLSIPPGAANHRVSAVLNVPEDVEIFSFLPHMHVRGKAYRYEARLANGERQMLLDIPRYDFNWQLEYKLKTPVMLPKGTRIIGTAWYDNSENNPANPDPTRRVGWGDQTTDEMMLGYLMYSFVDPKSNERLGGFRRR